MFRVGEKIYFSKERLERAYHRTSLSNYDKPTPTDRFVIGNYGKPLIIKRVVNYHNTLYIEVQDFYGIFLSNSFGAPISDQLPEELFHV